MVGLLLLVLLLPFSAIAEESILGEVIVTPPVQQKSAPASDSTVTATVIESSAWEGRSRSLPEVLEETAGLSLKRYGGLDDFATVSIRGSTSEQVAVFVDGVLQNPAEGGGVNLATLPLDQIERIEVYRGAAPVRFLTSSLGGVVAIETKSRGPKRVTEVAGSYGSWNTIGTSLFQSQQLTPLSYSAGYQFGHSDGDFSYRDDGGTPFNPADDRELARKNNEWNRHNLSLRLGRAAGGGDLELEENFLREDRGIPGLASFQSLSSGLSTTRTTTQLHWKKEGWRFAPFFQFQEQRFTDPLGEIGLGSQDNRDNTYAYGMQSISSHLIGRRQVLTLAAAYRGESFRPEDRLTAGFEPSSNRHQVSLGLEDEIVLLGERLVLNPSIRSESVVNDLAASGSRLFPISGKVGARYRVLPDLDLLSNIARAHRLPSFSELFGDRGSLVGNPDLAPETGWNGEIGAEFHPAGWRAGVNYFLNHSENLIQLLQTSQFTAQSQNLTSARIQGVESSLAIPLAGFLDLSGNYTFQSARETSGLPGTDGKFLPGRPRHEATAKTELHNRLGKLFGEVTLMDGNFLDSQNLLRVSNRTLLSAGAVWFPAKRIQVGVDGKNLLNDRVVDVVGFPLPGRSFYGRVEVAL